jgi:cytochrome c biogenesis protein CcmG/thiol:disulfide interchange protein DsbE
MGISPQDALASRDRGLRGRLGAVLGELRRHWKFVTATGLIIALPVAYVIVSQTIGRAAPAPSGQAGLSVGFARVSRPAPAFSLARLGESGTVGLPQLAGKPIVLNFWSSTCTVCRQESPAIASVARGVAGRVNFLGIDTLDSATAAMAFVRRYGLTYPVAFDPAGSAANSYGVPGLPVTFFLADSGRRIIGVNVGALSARHLAGILRQLYGLGS